MDDSQAIRQIAAAEDEGAVFAVARAFFRTQGFAALSYARPSRTDPGRSEVTSFGFPEGFVASYRERLQARRHDPDRFAGAAASKAHFKLPTPST